MDFIRTLDFVGIQNKKRVPFHAIVTDGLITKESIETLIKKTGISSQVLFTYLDITTRAIQNYSKKDVLKITIGDRLMDMALLYTHGEEVFGKTENFNNWLNSPSVDFDGEKPVTLLVSSQGLKEIDRVLSKIEQGIPA